MVQTAFQAAKVMTPTSGGRAGPDTPGLNLSGMSQRGFTLLELLVVLSIIIIASAVVLPNITGTESNLLVAQVRQTANAFKYARRIAIVEGAPQVATLMQVDPSSPEYAEIKGQVLQRATIPVMEEFEAQVTFQADIYDDPEALEVIQIEFFPQGGSTGGTLHFTLEDLTASIRIDPITGKVEIRYPGEEFEDDYYR